MHCFQVTDEGKETIITQAEDEVLASLINNTKPKNSDPQFKQFKQQLKVFMYIYKY